MPINQHAPRTITAIFSMKLSAPLVELDTISAIAPVSTGMEMIGADRLTDCVGDHGISVQ
jgi:hypothetical protein